MRRLVRALGALLIVAGGGCLVWALIVWQWQDPFTNLYTRYEQRKLADRYEQLVALERTNGGGAGLATARTQLEQAARRAAARAGRGGPLGRIRIPAIGVDMLFVNGTDRTSLKKGPGRYAGAPVDLDGYVGSPPRAYMPGERNLVYIAGHRTTYGAPFSRIDRIKKRDRVVLELPYATFTYSITGYRIVPATRIEILRSRGAEQLALQACHPRFMATERYIVYAKPVRIVLANGATVATAAG
jgi:sortase A